MHTNENLSSFFSEVVKKTLIIMLNRVFNLKVVWPICSYILITMVLLTIMAPGVTKFCAIQSGKVGVFRKNDVFCKNIQ